MYWPSISLGLSHLIPTVHTNFVQVTVRSGKSSKGYDSNSSNSSTSSSSSSSSSSRSISLVVVEVKGANKLTTTISTLLINISTLGEILKRDLALLVVCCCLTNYFMQCHVTLNIKISYSQVFISMTHECGALL
uniref:Uncharacterized protein n=1 Tax=Glossina austeni TaxID=7395 RepID=A0A1A9UPU0_GLOAU